MGRSRVAVAMIFGGVVVGFVAQLHVPGHDAIGFPRRLESLDRRPPTACL